MLNIECYDDSAALARAAARMFVAQTTRALETNDRVHVVLAGGQTPRAMNALLVTEPYRSAVAWDRLHFWFGDERCVPPNHTDSNFRMTRETLFVPLGIAEHRIERIHGEEEPHIAAAAYDKRIREVFGETTRFALVFLGMGPDGHTASLFPGTVAELDPARHAVANWVQPFASWRVTMMPATLNAARVITVTCGGAEKADALAAVLEGPHDPDRYPVQLIAPSDGELHWLIDEAAAAKLLTPATPTSSGSSSRG